MTDEIKRQVDAALDNAIDAIVRAKSCVDRDLGFPVTLAQDWVTDAERWLAHARSGLNAAESMETATR